MNKSFFAALVVAIFVAGLVWICHYLSLPFWLSLLSASLFFATPQNSLQGLITTLLSALIGILMGMIFIHIRPIIPHFPYQMEALVGISVFLLYLITQINYLNYFASTLACFALIVIQDGNWIILCQTVVLGILFGFVAKMISVLLTGRNITR